MFYHLYAQHLCYLPETNIVSWVYNFVAILWLQHFEHVIIIIIIIIVMFLY